ncbi:MAG: DJ-1/PfpI family protein [Alphaproteobacteria bacterium]
MSDSAKKLPVAILVAAGFAEQQLTDSQKTLFASGRRSSLVSPDGGLVQGWHRDAWGHHFTVDASLSEVLSADFLALLVIGGSRGVLSLRDNPHAKRLIKAFVDAGKSVGAIGDAVSLLASAEVVSGRRVAATTDDNEFLRQAGACVDTGRVSVDENLVTSADDGDTREFLEAFERALDAAAAGVDEAA